jgi:hypothetical protein
VSAALARLRALHALRGRSGTADRREKASLVSSLARARWQRAAHVAAWHDELLFLVAFPDSVALHRAARRALERIEARVRALPPSQRSLLDDSGIAGSATTHTFMYGAARWLAAHAERVSLAWEREHDAERLDPLLQLAMTAAEGDHFESGMVGTAEWLAAASTGSGGAGPWLLAAAPDPSTSAGRAWRAFYDAARVPLRWSLAGSARSASRAHVPQRPVIRRGLRTLPADPCALIGTPLHGIVRLRGGAAARWHDAALAALVSRTREVFPTVHCDLRDMHLAPLGEGAALCLFGAPHGDRSAIEANYGYVLFANGVPIGYGGVTTLGAQANTGANLFGSFRHSEAAFLFAQALRAFRTLLGVSRFIVNPYQLGAGNDEALTSGAYWFYDRLGFRPVVPQLSALAGRERAAIARDRSHRSSLRTLRALARGDVVLALPGAERTPLIPERRLAEIGARASRILSAVPLGARDGWMRDEARALLLRCTGERRALTAAEWRGAQHLMPVLVPLRPRIERWSAADRRALWTLVALKGRAQETGFARAAARHLPLQDAIRAMRASRRSTAS